MLACCANKDNSVQHTEGLPFLREALLFLALAGLLMPLLQRLHINQVLGFLGAGVIVGPFGLGLWAGEHSWLRYCRPRWQALLIGYGRADPPRLTRGLTTVRDALQP